MAKALSGPKVYGDSKEEKKRAMNDAIKLLEVVGHPTVILNVIYELDRNVNPEYELKPRLKNLSKILKKLKKTI